MSSRRKWEQKLTKLARQEPDPGTRVARRNAEELRDADELEGDYRRNRFLRQHRRKRRTQ